MEEQKLHQSSCHVSFALNEVNKEPEVSCQWPAVKDGIPVDRGWAWMVALGTFVLFLLVSGHGVALSVLLLDIVEHFDTSLVTCTIMLSLNYLAFSLACGISTNVLLAQLSLRTICLVASIANTVSTFLMAWAPTMACFIGLHAVKYACYGVVLAPALTLVAHYFERRRSLVSSLVLLGLSVAAIVYPMFIAWWKVEYGFHSCFIFLSGLEAQGIPASALLRPLSHYTRVSSLDVTQSCPGQGASKENGENPTAVTSDVHWISSEKRPMTWPDAELTGRHDTSHRGPSLSEVADIKYRKVNETKRFYQSSNTDSCVASDMEICRELVDTEYEDSPKGELFRNALPRAPGFEDSQEKTRSLLASLTMSDDKALNPNSTSLSSDVHHETRESCVCQRPVDLQKSVQTHTVFQGPFWCAGKNANTSHIEAPLLNVALTNDNELTVRKLSNRRSTVISRLKRIEDSCTFSGFIKAFLDLEALKTWSGFAYLVSYVLSRSGFFVAVYLPSYASHHGLNKTQAALLLVIYGGVDMVSRVIFGAIGDLHFTKPKYIIAATALCSGVVVCMAKLFTTFTSLVFLSATLGLFGCVGLSLLTNNIIDIHGFDKLGRFMTLSCQGLNVGNLLQFPVLALLIKATGQLVSVFYYVGCCYFLAALLLMTHSPPSKVELQPFVKAQHFGRGGSGEPLSTASGLKPGA